MECWSNGSKPNTPIGLIAPETFAACEKLEVKVHNE
jgi:hypothetical protein